MRIFRRKNGQSTIEFALVLFAFIFFLSVSYNAVVSFVVYQYLSYATFMSARAYQAARATPEEQLKAAQNTMAIYVPNVKPGPQNTVYSYSKTRRLATIKNFMSPSAATVKGKFSLEFEVPFMTLPIGDLRKEFGTIKLKTESMLGREPNRSECLSFFQRMFDSLRIQGATGNTPHNSEGMEDNGC